MQWVSYTTTPPLSRVRAARAAAVLLEMMSPGDGDRKLYLISRMLIISRCKENVVQVETLRTESYERNLPEGDTLSNRGRDNDRESTWSLLISGRTMTSPLRGQAHWRD